MCGSIDSRQSSNYDITAGGELGVVIHNEVAQAANHFVSNHRISHILANGKSKSSSAGQAWGYMKNQKLRWVTFARL
jgi:hypothetical protein